MDLHSALQELANNIKGEILKRMSSPIGVNPRTGTNTLVDSDLYQSVDVKVMNDETLTLSILAHWEYVALGWRSSGRFPNTMDMFVRNIIDWIRRKGIHFQGKTENSTAWAIVKSIIRRGIKARPFLVYDPNEDPSVIMPFLDEFIDEFFDKVFDDICSELDVYFN